jgi:hypothetical protein
MKSALSALGICLLVVFFPIGLLFLGLMVLFNAKDINRAVKKQNTIDLVESDPRLEYVEIDGEPHYRELKPWEYYEKMASKAQSS